MPLLPDFTDYQLQRAAFAARQEALLPATKATLFAALAGAGIKLVTLAYDGAGDSGQLEEMTVIDDDDRETELPDLMVDIEEATIEEPQPQRVRHSVRHVIEELAWRFLEQTHDGWENGNGAEGEFTFTVADQTISLGHNERFTDYSHYNYQF